MQDRGSTSSANGVLICANPFSGSGPNRKYVDRLVDALNERGFKAELVWELRQRVDMLSSPDLADWCRCVLVAGGDGSIGAVVNELAQAGRLNGEAGKRVCFATMPMGNENLFADLFGFGRNAKALADAIEAGRTHRLDLGGVWNESTGEAGRLFTLMAGIGFDADVVHRVDRWRTSGQGLRRVNRMSYMPKILSASVGYQYPRLTVEADGKSYTGTHLFVFNLPAYGGGLRLAPEGCCGNDGLLDWVLFERPGLVPLLGNAVRVLARRHIGSRGVYHGRARELTVKADGPAPIQVDGDPVGTGLARIGILDGLSLELLKT